eukprot:TRINITY_DN3006_c0_g1_i1.p1 TRINITY_DN3006_c0_g1~~TRINITY_DN3006_c0_g1_i1.p1  ORF type:complete len:552 (+),score=190.99 TRINITY_DN3006_c0_g1_i1:73-1728(+)
MDSDDETLSEESSEDLQQVAPCTTTLLTGNQFRAMMERDVGAKKPAKPPAQGKRVGGPYGAAGKGMNAALLGAGVARDGGAGADCYEKMLEAKELARTWQEENRVLKGKLREEEHMRAELQQRHDGLLTHVETHSAPAAPPGTQSLLKENVRLNKRIGMLTDRSKAKTAELAALQAKLDRNPRKAKQQMAATHPDASSTAASRDWFMTPDKNPGSRSVNWSAGVGNETQSTQPHRARGQRDGDYDATPCPPSQGDMPRAVLQKSQERLRELKQERKELKKKADGLFGKYWFFRLAWEAGSRRQRALVAALEKQRAEFDAGNAALATSDAALATSNAALATLEKSAAQHKERAAALQALLNRQTESTFHQHSSASSLQQDYAALLETHAAKLEEIQSLRDEMLGLDKELRVFQAKAKHGNKSTEAKTAALFKKDVQSRDETIARLEREVGNLAAMNRELKQNARALQVTTHASLENTSEKAAAKGAKMEERAAAMQAKLDRMGEENRGLKKERTELLQEAKEKDSAIAQLKEKCEQYRQQQRRESVSPRRTG